MKFEVFDGLIQIMENEICRVGEMERKLQTAFGELSCVMLEHEVIEELIELICEEYGEVWEDLLLDLLYRTAPRNTFYYNDVEYDDTNLNVWLMLEGKL